MHLSMHTPLSTTGRLLGDLTLNPASNVVVVVVEILILQQECHFYTGCRY